MTDVNIANFPKTLLQMLNATPNTSENANNKNRLISR